MSRVSFSVIETASVPLLLLLCVIEHVRRVRWDITGASICLIGAAIIVLGPRS